MRDYPVDVISACYAEGLTFWSSEFLKIFTSYKNKTRRKSEEQKTCCYYNLGSLIILRDKNATHKMYLRHNLGKNN